MNNNDLDRSEGKHQEESERHKFKQDFCQAYENAFIWRFGYYIDIMERFAEYLGRDKLIEMIKRAVDERNERGETDNARSWLLQSSLDLGRIKSCT